MAAGAARAAGARRAATTGSSRSAGAREAASRSAAAAEIERLKRTGARGIKDRDDGGDPEDGAPEAGREPRRRRARDATRRLGSARAAGVTVDDGAGVLLGALVWVLVLQYLQGGMTQVRAWLNAKFLNRVGDQ